MKNNQIVTISELIDALPSISKLHYPGSSIYDLLEKISRLLFDSSNFNSKEVKFSKISSFGDVCFPYVKMGSVSSLDIFSSLNELIIFSFYIKNKDKYKNVIDIGANIGLHSILMAKLGWNVFSYEPDPLHLEILNNNIEANNLKNIKVFESAVSSENGQTDFLRVLGNTTSSHIVGSKDAPYGDLMTIKINTVNISDIVSNIDFIKIDAEGHEAQIICAIPQIEFYHLDVMVEIGNKNNALLIFNYCNSIGLNLFSQKIGWGIVNTFDQMPQHYKEGSLFISRSMSMPWS